MPRSPDPATTPLEKRLTGYLEGRTLRELAAEIGVDHVVLWKASKGKGIRPGSREAILRGLERISSGDLGEALTRIRRHLASDLGSRAAVEALQGIEAVIASAYQSRRIPSPFKRGKPPAG